MQQAIKPYQGLFASSTKNAALCLLIFIMAWMLMSIELVVKWLKNDIAFSVQFANHLLLSQLALLPNAKCSASYCHPLNEISSWNQWLVTSTRSLTQQITHSANQLSHQMPVSVAQYANAGTVLQWARAGIANLHLLFKLCWLAFEVVLTKFMVMILSLPLLLIAAFMGLVDGLVMRDIRKMGVGRESALLFHAVKKKLFPTILLFVFVFLVLPMPITPSVIILPLACCIGVLTAISASRFKKYV